MNKYNNAYHKTIKIKPVDVKSRKYKKDSKFKVDDHVRILKCKNIFAKGYTPNWSDVVLVIKKVKNNVPSTYVIIDLKGEEVVGTFYKKELQKTNRNEFRIEKVKKRKGDKLNVKQKGYNNSFNSWIDEKGVV